MFTLQDWALGVLYTKIMCALVMMGPNWWLKTNLEHIYLGGVRGLDLNLLVGQTALPVIACLGACLTVPYVTAHTIAPLLAPPSALVSSQPIFHGSSFYMFHHVCGIRNVQPQP